MKRLSLDLRHGIAAKKQNYARRQRLREIMGDYWYRKNILKEARLQDPLTLIERQMLINKGYGHLFKEDAPN